MGEQFFDDLAKSLDDDTISRRRALKLAGGALLASMVPPLFPREAEAINRAKRRCRRRGESTSRGEIAVARLHALLPQTSLLAIAIRTAFALKP
jgi:hypothetical protein